MRHLPAFLLSFCLGLAPAGAALAQGGPVTPRAALPGAAPAPAPPRGAEARRAELDGLFKELTQAPDEASGALIEARIRSIWSQGASPAVKLLINRGVREMQAEAADEAVQDFEAATVLQDDYADAQVLLAQALTRVGDTRGAALALQRALVLEPKHFGALLTLSSIQDEAGDLKGALRSLEAALAIHPRMEGGAARLRDLSRRALGEAM